MASRSASVNMNFRGYHEDRQLPKRVHPAVQQRAEGSDRGLPLLEPHSDRVAGIPQALGAGARGGRTPVRARSGMTDLFDVIATNIKTRERRVMDRDMTR